MPKEKPKVWRYKKWMLCKGGIIIILPQSWKKAEAEEVWVESTGEQEITVRPVKSRKEQEG